MQYNECGVSSDHFTWNRIAAAIRPYLNVCVPAAETHTLLRTLPGHVARVPTMHWTDGGTLATGSRVRSAVGFRYYCG